MSEQETIPPQTPETQAAPATQPAPVAPTPAPAAHERSSGGDDHRGRGGSGGGGGQHRSPRRPRVQTPDESGFSTTLVRIYRCAKVIKGGRSFSFGALVVAGDRAGKVGIGYGKANEVPLAVEKGGKNAKKVAIMVPLKAGTIPHVAWGQAGASRVILVPARPGTGVRAGKSVRPILELAGITDVLSKAYGSTSPKNLMKAAIAALASLKTRDQVQKTRRVELPAWAGDFE